MEKRRWGGVAAWCLSALCAAAMLLPAQVAHAAEGNLALNKPAVADSQEADTVEASNATDGDTASSSSRWGSAVDSNHGEHWIYVDLGKDEQVSSAKVYWEARKATGFKIQVAKAEDARGDDPTKWAWKDVYTTAERPKEKTSVVNFDKTSVRYVRLLITGFTGNDPYGDVVDWDAVSIYELEVYADKQIETPDEPSGEATNLALKKTTKASKDHHNENGGRAVDGKKKDAKADRWMTETKPTAQDPQWLVVDLGKSETIKHIEAMWENAENYSTKFSVYASDDASCWENPAMRDGWGAPIYTTDSNKAPANSIDLETPAKGRYVKLEITEVFGWGASCMEFEVWNGEPPAPEKQPADYLNDIVIAPVTAETAKLSFELPKAPEGYEITYNGTDYEQVIDLDGAIYRPVSDVTVKASFKIANTTDDTDYAFKEFDVAVPGSMTTEAQGNAAPKVLPELREWVGGTGAFSAASAKRVVYGHDSLKVMAADFAADFHAITGVELAVVQGTAAQAGDIFFTLGADAAQGLKDEGYLLEAIADRISVEAEAVAGANWGGKTILQGMRTGGSTFPVGTTRDYPLYKIRSIILDVGRKTFTLDWLKQMTKQMAFYKMNDFQIHLNDNLIPLEHYKDEDVFQAYSAFRLESDIKQGGNNGKNKADLTAKDVWYSKKDFKSYIEHSKALGVNIIPEIDTPAHSLALTKVRPDLRHGTSGRQNDHLDIAKQYDACLEFVQSIFDEYVKGGEESVFADVSTIHIGADEYTADGNAYRNFVNDMFKYAESNGKKARVWGSLTTIKGSVQVKGVTDDGAHRREMNLWNPGWADLTEMYNLGFELIDCQDGVFYIVPNAGYYYDYLGDAAYTDALNSISGVTIPAGDPQMIGGAYAVWNDMCDYLENGISEYDIYDRIDHSLGLFAANAWGKGPLDVAGAKQAAAQIGDAPNTNFGYQTAADENGVLAHWGMESLEDSSQMDRDLEPGKNAGIQDVDGKSALKLNGGESYVPVRGGALTTVGLGNDLRVKVKRTSASTEPQVLFESEYGRIMAVQEGTGKVGFTRENHAFSFNYELPLDEWVELELKNEFAKTHLYVNGELVDTLGDGDKAAEGKALKATTMFPVARIGSTADAFEGYVDDVRLGSQLADGAEPSKVMDLEYAVQTVNALLDAQAGGPRSLDAEKLESLVAQARELLAQYNPAQAEVDALLAQINALILDEDGEPAYKTADYCRLEAYAQLQGGEAAETLAALFTDESVAYLQSVWGKVRADLPASMQSTVDGWESEVVRALDALQPKASADLTLIDPASLVAEAANFEPGQEPNKVLDGDPSTLWHSKWGTTNAKPPYEIVLKSKSGEAMPVNGLVYTPRSDAGNGNATSYKVEVSADGTSYTKVAEGELANDASVKTIPFDRVEAAFVRFTIVKGAGNFGSAAEIRLSDADAKGDFEGLNALIEIAKQVKRDGACDHDSFAAETWNALTESVTSADAMMNVGTAKVNEVHAAKVELAKAIVALRLEAKSDEPGSGQGGQGEQGGQGNQGGQNPGPSEPGKPGQNKPGATKPSGSLPTTGDNSMLVVAGVGVAAIVALAVGVTLVMRSRRSR